MTTLPTGGVSLMLPFGALVNIHEVTHFPPLFWGALGIIVAVPLIAAEVAQIIFTERVGCRDPLACRGTLRVTRSAAMYGRCASCPP